MKIQEVINRMAFLSVEEARRLQPESTEATIEDLAVKIMHKRMATWERVRDRYVQAVTAQTQEKHDSYPTMWEHLLQGGDEDG